MSISPWVEFEWFVSGRLRYPFIPAQLRRGATSMDGFPLMLVDTGADVSLLPMTFARALGVREEELRRTAMAGIGGGTTAYRLVHAPAIVARIGVHEVELSEVQFVPHAPLILGRDALFGNLELRMTRERIALRNTYSSP